MPCVLWIWDVMELRDIVVRLQKQHSYLHWFHLLTPLGVYKVRLPLSMMTVPSSRASWLRLLLTNSSGFRFLSGGAAAISTADLFRASSCNLFCTVDPIKNVTMLILMQKIYTNLQGGAMQLCSRGGENSFAPPCKLFRLIFWKVSNSLSLCMTRSEDM